MVKDSGKRFWNRSAAIYNIFQYKDRQAYDMLAKLLCQDLTPDMKVLELAAGTGLLSQRISACCSEIVVTDYSEEMLKKAQNANISGKARFELADATNLSYKDASFDAVIIANALHIMPSPELALANIGRVLKKGGILAAPTFIRKGTQIEKMKEKAMGLFGFKTVSHWNQEGYHNFLKQNGWRVVKNEIVPARFDIAYVVATMADCQSLAPHPLP